MNSVHHHCSMTSASPMCPYLPSNSAFQDSEQGLNIKIWTAIFCDKLSKIYSMMYYVQIVIVQTVKSKTLYKGSKVQAQRQNWRIKN